MSLPQGERGKQSACSLDHLHARLLSLLRRERCRGARAGNRQTADRYLRHRVLREERPADPGRAVPGVSRAVQAEKRFAAGFASGSAGGGTDGACGRAGPTREELADRCRQLRRTLPDAAEVEAVGRGYCDPHALGQARGSLGNRHQPRRADLVPRRRPSLSLHLHWIHRESFSAGRSGGASSRSPIRSRRR